MTDLTPELRDRIAELWKEAQDALDVEFGRREVLVDEGLTIVADILRGSVPAGDERDSALIVVKAQFGTRPGENGPLLTALPLGDLSPLPSARLPQVGTDAVLCVPRVADLDELPSAESAVRIDRSS